MESADKYADSENGSRTLKDVKFPDLAKLTASLTGAIDPLNEGD